MIVSIKRPAHVALIVLAMAAGCALLLALPGQTVTTKYLNDLFIFLDGAHRVTLGQVPNRDFHTALGPIVYYAPAVGYWLSGTFGGAMPIGIALVILSLAPAAAHILSSRLRPAIALPLGLYLLLIAAVPINLGEGIGSLSFAMFYNRIGWSLLGFLLIMHLRPAHPHRHQIVLDALAAACLVLLMLYTKISYGAVGLGFLVLMLLDPQQRRWAAGALGLVLACGLVVEAFWGGTAAHIRDLLLAGRVSGNAKPPDQLVMAFLRSLSDYVVFILLAAIVLWRSRCIRDFLFFGFCAGSGYLLILQNFQNWGIITLAAGAAVAVESLARADGAAADRKRHSLTAGAQLLLCAFLLPTIVHNAASLGLHTALAATRQGQAAPLAKFENVRLVQLWSEGDYAIFSRYFASLEDGAQALSSLDREAAQVLVLDFVSPFSAGLGLKTPQGDSTWHHWGRTINEDHHLPAKQLFRDVRVVMEPKWPIEHWTANGMRQVYSDYIEEHFELAQETADWKVYVLGEPASETVSRSYGSDPDERLLDTTPASGG
jgi:hypothetical protein